MPETRETKKSVCDSDTDKVNKDDDDQPSHFFRPDDPLIRDYEASKKKLKKATEDVMPDEEEQHETVRAMRSFVKKRRSDKIIKQRGH